MPPADAGDAGAALGDRPGSSRTAKADPRRTRDVPRRLPPRRGAEGLPAAADCGATLRKPPVAPRPAQGSGAGCRRPGRRAPQPIAPATGLPPRPSFECQAASTHVPASSARPRAPISRRRARRPCPGDGYQIQPDTRMRSSVPDDSHRSVVGRSGRLGAHSHLICMPQDADHHDAATGGYLAGFGRCAVLGQGLRMSGRVASSQFAKALPPEPD
jgi:hypothetical protein